MNQHSFRAIEAAIVEYINAPSLKGKMDVAQFESKVFRRVADDPTSALINFGPLLERTMREMLKEKIDRSEVAQDKPGKTSSKKEFDNLDKYIKQLDESNANKRLIIDLDTLRAWRNFYLHGSPTPGQSDYDVYPAQQCAIKILHFLVWKYECWLVNKPEDAPRSWDDKRLLFSWGMNETLEIGEEIIDKVVNIRQKGTLEKDQVIDAWGMATTKSRVYALSEMVAQEAEENAAIAAAVYPYATFTLLVPLICDLRWKRGYLSALRRMLDIPVSKKTLGEFHCEDVRPECPVDGGLLSAEPDNKTRVLIRLDGHPVLHVCDLSDAERNLVLDSVNSHGRLGLPGADGMTLRQRIEQLEVQVESSRDNRLQLALFRNREALLPLIAKLGLPGGDWLLPSGRELPKLGIHLTDNLPAGVGSDCRPLSDSAVASHDQEVVEDTFYASRAYRQPEQASFIRQLGEEIGPDTLEAMMRAMGINLPE